MVVDLRRQLNAIEPYEGWAMSAAMARRPKFDRRRVLPGGLETIEFVLISQD